MPALVFHMLPFSHPCMAVDAALRLKGLEHERVVMPMPHDGAMREIYGPDRHTVPGMLVDGEPVHGSRAILERLETLAPDPSLYPQPIAGAVRAAERWGDEELQDLGRSLSWGALHFRPDALGTFAGGGPLDPAGTDYAIKLVRAVWRHHRISAQRIAGDLAGLPAKLDRVDALAEEGIVGGDAPTAADLQIGATLRVLLAIGDLRPLIDDRPAGAIARRLFPDYSGNVPAGAFPPQWMPAAASVDRQGP